MYLDDDPLSGQTPVDRPEENKGEDIDEVQMAVEHVVAEARRAAGEGSGDPGEPLPAPSVVAAPTDLSRQAGNAFLIELIAGLFGLLGVGYMYVGKTSEGIARLVIWLVVVGTMWIGMVFLMALVVGFCLIPVAVAIHIGVPAWSALALKSALERQQP